MKPALNLAAVLLMAMAAVPASAQRGGPGAGPRAAMESGLTISREARPIDPGDNHHARRRWNAANDDNHQARRRWNAANSDAGTRIRRPGHHQARRRWNAANGNDRQAN